MKANFHKKNFTLKLVLKRGQTSTRKWPIVFCIQSIVFFTWQADFATAFQRNSVHLESIFVTVGSKLCSHLM